MYIKCVVLNVNIKYIGKYQYIHIYNIKISGILYFSVKQQKDLKSAHFVSFNTKEKTTFFFIFYLKVMKLMYFNQIFQFYKSTSFS